MQLDNITYDDTLSELAAYAKNSYYPQKGYGATAGVCFAYSKANANTIELWVYQEIPNTKDGVTTRKIEGELAKFDPDVVPVIIKWLQDLNMQLVVNRTGTHTRTVNVFNTDGDLLVSEEDEHVTNEFVSLKIKTDDNGPAYIQLRYGLKNMDAMSTRSGW